MPLASCLEQVHAAIAVSNDDGPLGAAAQLPAGGGRVVVDIAPVPALSPIELVAPLEIETRRARALLSRLPRHIAERELKAGVDASGSRGGSAIVMDPFTGEILAMANYPAFNPNAYRDFSVDARRNRAVQDLYEPGSTFKIVTASAALDERVVSPDDLIDVSAGAIDFPGRPPIRATFAFTSTGTPSGLCERM